MKLPGRISIPCRNQTPPNRINRTPTIVKRVFMVPSVAAGQPTGPRLLHYSQSGEAIGAGAFDSAGQTCDTWGMITEKQPDPARLLERLQISLPLIGFYDSPDPAAFGPLVEPDPGQCVFCFYRDWLAGRTLHLTKERYGCGGAAGSLFGMQTRPRAEFIKFLADDEGLKASHALMEKWLKVRRTFRAENGHIFVGPLREDAWP